MKIQKFFSLVLPQKGRPAKDKAIMRQSEKYTLLTYWTGACLGLLIALGGAAMLIMADYRERFENERHDTLMVARSLAEYTTQIFSSIDTTGRLVADDWVRAGTPEDLTSLLKSRADADPAVVAISISDALGRILATSADSLIVGKQVLDAEDHLVGTSRTAMLLGLDLSGSKGFQEIRRTGGPKAIMGLPLKSSPSQRSQDGRWVVNYMRRIDGARGSFNGAVVITVDNLYLQNFYATLDPHGLSIISLVGTDGVVRAWSGPGPSIIGRNLGALIHADSGLSSGTAIRPALLADGAERIWGFSEVPGFPLKVYVGVPTQQIYRSFIIAAAVISSLALSLVSALVAFGLLLTRYMHRREETTRTLVKAAAERRERLFFKTIFNAGGMLGLIADPRGRPVLANRAFLSLFQLPDTDVARIGWLKTILRRELSEILSALPYKADVPIIDRNGKRREVSFTVTAIKDEDGALRSIVVIGFDNTSRRAAELAIYQSSKLIKLGEMATGLAHELNQPLSTIGLAVDNFKARIDDGDVDEASLRFTLARIDQNVKRATAIINHMRIFGRRSEGRLAVFDPVEAIEGALTLAEAYLSSSGIVLTRNCRAGTGLVKTDRILVEQILLNLISNARDAILEAQDGEPNRKGAIEMLVSRNCNDIVISVVDNGHGIPPAIIDRIFDPFFTTKAVGKGTGLGLALSYGIAVELGGHLSARNREIGAEFTLVLPAEDKVIADTGPRKIAAVI